jgi:tRNA G18 (ribose-2'-O)-methylase SpoU
VAVLIIIDDPLDPRIAAFHLRERGLNTRANRREHVAAGLFVAEGDLVVERALRAGCIAVSAFVDSNEPPPVTNQFGADVPIYGGTQEIRRVGMGLGVPLSIVALFHRPSPVDPGPVSMGQRVLALEGVDNPVNVGAVVRSAAALGWHGLLLDRTSADPLARRALRVSMGTAFSLPFARAENLAATLSNARNGGALIVALTPAANSMPIHAILPATDQPVILLIGSERTGLSAELIALSSVRADIPMAAGVDSLNAAAAAAIACYTFRPAHR